MNSNIKIFLIFIILLGAGATSSLFLDVGTASYELKNFSSYDQLLEFLKDKVENNYYRGYPETMKTNGALDTQEGASTSTSEYSKTNIQVEGVDEPDMVKTDGTYIYVISNEDVYIIKAYPADEAKKLSYIKFDSTPYNMFINDDYLIVFTTTYGDFNYYNTGYNHATMYLYDTSDKTNPILVKTIEVNGSYLDARMIDSYVYMIAYESTWDIYREGELKIPTITVDEETEEIQPSDIYYVDIPEPVETMTHIVSLDIDTKEFQHKSFLLGYSQNIYVSQDNIYVASIVYQSNPIALTSHQDEKTMIHKIAISDGDISYIAQGEVKGHILNQFSMDEYNGFFRIATTIGNIWDGSSRNNIYILDEDLKQAASIEDIAPGEKIYSARFIGDKAYLVTFKKVDPFFTIDLSDPYHPKILGKLKIPGYSDYLHPYDENHIIGIGKETAEALSKEKEDRDIDFAWYQGLKIALFDVSDFQHPKELDKVIIGDRGTDSPALYDHKAFLFDYNKKLLVIPVSVYEIDEDIKTQHGNYTGNIYGEFTFQGVYVYHLSVEDGFQLLGRITHMDNESYLKDGYYAPPSTSITRSLYIDNILYTISQSMVKLNSLDNLEELKHITLQ
ncbi:MAG: hypothetical protein DRN12_05575 [Thermoplasmata archaeon]|nr:MAG: hypothetical protein DRN12_05575 [Thermoplasmata archaeon]